MLKDALSALSNLLGDRISMILRGSLVNDDQIRDLFQNADEWLPDNDASVGPVAATNPAALAGAVAGTGTGAPANPLPQLQLGSDVEIAACFAQALRQDRGEVIFSEGHFWYYANRTGARSRTPSCVAWCIVTTAHWFPALDSPCLSSSIRLGSTAYSTR